MKFDEIGDLGITLLVAAGLKSEVGVRNVVDRIVHTVGPDDRVVNYEEIRREREQRIIYGRH